MEKDIAEGQLGQVGSYDLEFKEGSLCLKLQTQVGVSMEVKVGADAVLDAIAKATQASCFLFSRCNNDSKSLSLTIFLGSTA